MVYNELNKEDTQPPQQFFGPLGRRSAYLLVRTVLRGPWLRVDFAGITGIVGLLDGEQNLIIMLA